MNRQSLCIIELHFPSRELLAASILVACKLFSISSIQHKPREILFSGRPPSGCPCKDPQSCQSRSLAGDKFMSLVARIEVHLGNLDEAEKLDDRSSK